MKKILICSFLMLFFLLSLAGCSQNIVEKYPNIEDDFTKEDYKKLNDLSNGGTLSYEELCQAFIESNVDNEVNRIISELSNIGELSNLVCKKAEDTFTFSYNFKIDDGITVITFVTDVKEFKIKSIEYEISSLKFTARDNIIEVIEGDKDVAYQVNRSINRDFNIENKIYAASEKYYYLPIEDNKVRIYASKDNFDKSYHSSTGYWDYQLEENEKRIDELEENLERTEDFY